MIKNYLKVALRRFRRGGTHAAVNVIGLSLGMATCALIFMLVHHEWSYDRFHENASRIHRVYLEYVSPEGETGYQAMMTPDFTPTFKSTFPQLEGATRLAASGRDFKVGNQTTRHMLAEVDPDFFEMFTFPVLAGDAVASITDPTSMVVTTEAASALFDVTGENWSQAIGQTVTILVGDEAYDFNVGAVLAPIPNNSSITFDVAISFENYDNIRVGGNNWGGRTSTYALLGESVDPEALEASFTSFTDLEFGTYVEDMRNADRIADDGDAYRLKLQALPAMHSDIDVWVPYEADAHNPRYSMILAAIGMLILLIACINFMTLSVGQSTIRAREVGVRKVLGATQGQVAKQHWGESIVIAGVSLGIGLLLAAAATPAFNNLTGTELSLGQVSPVLIIVAVVFLTVVVGVFAGAYPAMILSRFMPARVLKGVVSSPRLGMLTRALIVLQFTISIGLIASTGIMTKQLGFLLTTDLGFDDDFVLAVDTRQVARSEADGVIGYFRDQLLAQEDIKGIARAGTAFAAYGSDRNGWADASGINRSAYNFGVDEDWADVLDMEIVAGRNFDKNRPSDATNAILVNEALVREFEIDDPVGYVMTNWLQWVYEESPTIVGVVKDFNYRSLHEEVAPAIMNMHPDYYNYFQTMLVKLGPDDVAGSLRKIEQAWSEVLPGKPFAYVFMDDAFAARYETEQRWRSLVTYSSALAIIIACLGLFALAILVVNRRTKEIGIRKVLGASVAGVTALLSREFAILVVIGSVVASPLAYLAMNSWLSGFAFTVSIGPWVFVGATLVTLAVALVTVGVHAMRAARANPVRALRYE